LGDHVDDHVEHPELAKLQELVQNDKMTIEEYQKRAAILLAAGRDGMDEL
jgi:hypothetical protein